MVLAVASYFNNPLTIAGCILTFFVVFMTTFTSYRLFGSNTYFPYLLIYFMMVANPVKFEDFPLRLIALVFGALFIVVFNIIINRNKDYKLSKSTIDNLLNDLNKGIDLKLEGKPVSDDNFKSIKGFYLTIYNKLEYKYFPSESHQSILNIVKALQYIGILISNYDFTVDELNYMKKVLSNIRDIGPEEIFTGIDFKTKEMSLILLNLEILSCEITKDLTDNTIISDRRVLFSLMRNAYAKQFSFKSAKFTFAFKMALMLFIWQILTWAFNLPFTKWLYFVTISLMVPYVDDLRYTAKSRIKGTLLGTFIFAFLLIISPYLNIGKLPFVIIVFGSCLFIMVLKLHDKFILNTVTTIMSVMSAVSYIPLPKAIVLRILWVVVGVIIVSIYNFTFMPYSVEKETKINLRNCYKLNTDSVKHIKDYVSDKEMYINKTTFIILFNILRENMEVTDQNQQLYDLQNKISDIFNFILTYLEIYPPSNDLKNCMIGIIDGDEDKISDNLNVKDKVITYSLNHLIKLLNQEKVLIEEID